jgi:hypothetical protein
LDGAAEIAGCIDNVGADGLFGWAWSPQFPEVNLPLEITADGGVIGETAAIVLREDLLSLGYGWPLRFSSWRSGRPIAFGRSPFPGAGHVHLVAGVHFRLRVSYQTTE